MKITADEKKALTLIAQHRDIYNECCELQQGSTEWKAARKRLADNRDNRRIFIDRAPKNKWSRIKGVDTSATADGRRLGVLDDNQTITRWKVELLAE